jgi:hypothetical protein
LQALRAVGLVVNVATPALAACAPRAGPDAVAGLGDELAQRLGMRTTRC